jgi:nucleoside-triphosphatase
VRIVVSGLQGSGKSTIVQKVRALLPAAEQAGFLTRAVVEGGKRAGFSLESFAGEREIFAHVDFTGTRRFGRFGVRLEAFDRLGKEIVSRASLSRFAVIDELGVMETGATDFVRSVAALFAAPRHALIVVQERALPFWMEQIGGRNIDRVYTVDREDRKALPDLIFKDFDSALS